MGAAMLSSWSWGQAAVSAALRRTNGPGGSSSHGRVVAGVARRPGLVDHADAPSPGSTAVRVASLMATHSLRPGTARRPRRGQGHGVHRPPQRDRGAVRVARDVS